MPKQAAHNEKFKHSFLFFIASLGTISLLLLTTINIETYINNKLENPEVLAKTTTAESEREFWTSFLEDNPEYIPGLAELASIEYELGNTKKAEELVEKIKNLDPNYEALKDLEDIIN